MGYGARAQRKPATGGAVLSDVDIYKIALVIKAERGFSGVVMDEIYSMTDFYKKCGGFNASYYGAYVAQSFFDELEKSISCEMKVLSFVSGTAAQATYSILDGSGTLIFTIKAGRKSVNDLSLFGNKIGIKITQTQPITMKLTTSVIDTDTHLHLDSVDNLQVGNYIRIVEGADSETRAITAIDIANKTVTVAAISESGGFSASGSTVYRQDWRLEVWVKDDLGNYQKLEVWEGPFAKSDTVGLASTVNDVDTGSDFVILAVNSGNTSQPENQRPAALTDITALSGGSDGTSAIDSDWDTLVDTYLTNEEHTILVAPESASSTHAINMISFSTDNYRSMAYVHAANAATADTLKAFGSLCRGSIKFGMLPSDKWIRVNDPINPGQFKEIPKTGIDAAHWFNTFYKFGESKVAAGNKSEMVLKASGKLLDSNGLVHDDSDGVGGRMIRNYSINICRYRKGKGITNNSARTFSTDDGYKYQNQIMQYLLYARSIVAYLREIEQDKAGSPSMDTHYNEVWAYMKGKYDDGHLFVGTKEDGTSTEFKDVCIIQNDFTNNTLVNIANGIEETFMQFVAPPPIEEPILSLASAGVTTVRK